MDSAYDGSVRHLALIGAKTLSQEAVDSSHPRVPAETLEFIRQVRERVATVVVGQEVVVERILISLITGGHLLLEGVPGLAKTLLVSCIAKSIALDFGSHPVHDRPVAVQYSRFGNSRSTRQ